MRIKIIIAVAGTSYLTNTRLHRHDRRKVSGIGDLRRLRLHLFVDRSYDAPLLLLLMSLDVD